MSPGCKRSEPPPLRPPPEPTGTLHIVGESQRLRTGDPPAVFSPWFDGARISLTGARGEVLGLQVFHAGAGAASMRFPSESRVAAQGFAVEHFEVRRPSTQMYGGSHGAGAYPDGLTATAPGAGVDTDPAYFEIEIARDAVSGVVRGELAIGARTVPIELTIAPVALPPLPLRVWAYFDPRELKLANADEAACIAMFRRHGVLLSPDSHLEDWPARKDQLAGIRDVPVWISEDPALAGDQVKRWIATLSGTGQVPFAIPIDEPRTPERRRQVRALAEVVRAAGGGPDSFRFAVTDEPRPEYGDLVDLYISPRAVHLTGDRHARWTYNGAPPQAGAMVLDAESPGTRTWGWISWRWQVPVWYVWDALYWHDRHNRKGAPRPGRRLDARADPVSFDDGEDRGNFDGVLALPGCRPTLRLAALRRGYQDRQLLELAAGCNKQAAAELAAELVPRALGDATGRRPAWPSEEAPWETARQKLIELASCTPPAKL